VQSEAFWQNSEQKEQKKILDQRNNLRGHILVLCRSVTTYIVIEYTRVQKRNYSALQLQSYVILQLL